MQKLDAPDAAADAQALVNGTIGARIVPVTEDRCPRLRLCT